MNLFKVFSTKISINKYKHEIGFSETTDVIWKIKWLTMILF